MQTQISTASKAGDGAEITPEMIEAGREAMSCRWADFVGETGYELWDVVLPEVFRAMLAARPLSVREFNRKL